MDVETFDREFNDALYYMEKEKTNNCHGCYLLSKGEGGENQLAHMDFGGCLYEDDSDIETSETMISKKIKYDKDSPKLCIICNEEIKNVSDILCCSSCESKEEKQRFIRYQNFIADNYLTR